MPVQFHCSHCGKRLKAPDSMGGKLCKCPACGAMQTTPEVLRDPEPSRFSAQPEPESISRPSFEGVSTATTDEKVRPNPIDDQPERIQIQTDHPRGRRSSPAANTRSQQLVWILGWLLVIGYGLATAVFLVSLNHTSEQSQGEAGVRIAALLIGPPVAVASLLLYFAPTAVAFSRDHQNTVPVFLINVFFGWTLIGWVGSLAWACSSSVKESRQYVRQVIVHE